MFLTNILTLVVWRVSSRFLPVFCLPARGSSARCWCSIATGPWLLRARLWWLQDHGQLPSTLHSLPRKVEVCLPRTPRARVAVANPASPTSGAASGRIIVLALKCQTYFKKLKRKSGVCDSQLDTCPLPFVSFLRPDVPGSASSALRAGLLVPGLSLYPRRECIRWCQRRSFQPLIQWCHFLREVLCHPTLSPTSRRPSLSLGAGI